MEQDGKVFGINPAQGMVNAPLATSYLIQAEQIRNRTHKFMTLKHRVAMVATLAFCCSLSAQTTFYFQFNDVPFSLGTGPTVGTGTFTFATDPGNGLFPFADLGAFTMNFNFNDGASLDQSDIVSDPSDMEVLISGSGPSRRLQFDDTGSGGGGPYRGSLDLTSGNAALSFEPSFMGAGLQLYEEEDIFSPGNSGDYLATAVAGASVPDGGSTFWLLGFGCFALTFAATRTSPKTVPVLR
jgi:hypothetical protein